MLGSHLKPSHDSTSPFYGLPQRIRGLTHDDDLTLNRYELTSRSTSNPGIEAIWGDERSRRRERDEDSQIPLDHSQPRVLPDNLSERESRFFQVAYTLENF